MANYYLQDFDLYASEMASQNKMEYFRYADDMLLFALNPETYEKVLYKLSMRLSDIGLKINQKKVSIKSLNDYLIWKGKLIQDSILDENDFNFLNNFTNVIEMLGNSKFRNNRWKQGTPILKTVITKSFYVTDVVLLRKILLLCLEKEFLVGLTAPYLIKVYSIAIKINEEEMVLQKINEVSESIIHNSVLFEFQEFFSKICPSEVPKIQQLIKKTYDIYK